MLLVSSKRALETFRPPKELGGVDPKIETTSLSHRQEHVHVGKLLSGLDPDARRC